MKRISILGRAAAICLMSTAVHATGFDTNDAVMNSVVAFVAAKNCPKLQINWPLMIKFLRFYNIETTDIQSGGKYHAAAADFNAKSMNDYNTSPRVFCTVASDMFEKSDPKLLIEE